MTLLIMNLYYQRNYNKRSVDFQDTIYAMKTITVNQDKIADSDEEAIPASAEITEDGYIDHPYYAEDLFVGATYSTDGEIESNDPPPPPPKTPPPPPKPLKKKVGLNREERRKSLEKKAPFLCLVRSF